MMEEGAPSGAGHPPDDYLQDQSLPLPVQTFLWRQISPFIRPKLGKHHETTCMELKEACKSFEKVLVQNIQYGLSLSLTDGVTSISRWRLIQAAFPHVMHCAANLLQNRKETQLKHLGATETKILYTLHWIILLAAEECADADREKGIMPNSPFHYLFSIPSITLFVYLFAPIFHHLKESDFQTFRLESGLKMWQALWDFRHPDTPCFTAHVKPKPRTLWNRFNKLSQKQFGDVFLGRQPSSDQDASSARPISPSAVSHTNDQIVITKSEPKSEEEGNWVSSPKDTVFPETIPEESSSTEEEHVVIFRLPSLTDTDGLEKIGTFYASDTSIFQVAVAKSSGTLRPTLTIEQISDASRHRPKPPPLQKTGSSTDRESTSSSKGWPGSLHKLHTALHSSDVAAATFLDVAVLRCLFMSQWPEEGLYWALEFYYHRLKEMSEESSSQHQPRRRSNSLPIPKIEISLYQSPDTGKRDSCKDFIDLPEEKDSGCLAESPYFARKQSETAIPSRRGSEKSKRKMKIADLRTFVETKILSRSEKTLEHIGKEENYSPFTKKEYHVSLDTGDERLSKPATLKTQPSDTPRMSQWGNLVKGKSMPSLSCFLDDTILHRNWIISDHERSGRAARLQDTHSHTITNPIITVTEHSPIPSPDDYKRHLPFPLDETLPQVSIDSQLDELSQQCRSSSLNAHERKPSLTRSQTDSNITYACDDTPEAPGAACFITNDGDIDIQVVLKAVHSAALRNIQSCTLRVCEVILNLLELLIEMGVLNKKNFEEASPGSSIKDVSGSEPDVKETVSTPKSLHEKQLTAHNLVLNTVLRVYKHLGCPHGCADGQRGPPAEFLRSQGQCILMKLHRSNEKQFSTFLRDFVKNQNLQDILEFFHSYLGFCVDPSSLLSPLRKHSDRETGPVVSRVVLDQKRSSSKSPDGGTSAGYANNFGANLRGGGPRGVETQIMNSIFKGLVSKFVKAQKELRLQENMPLYVDVRQLMTYVKEAHGGVFRRVALSGLLDTANRPNKETATRTTRVIRHVTPSETEEQGGDQAYFVDEKGQKRLLLKKKSTASTHGVYEGESVDEGMKSASPISNFKRRGLPTLTPRHSEKNFGVLAAMAPLRAAAVAAAAARQEKQPKLKMTGLVNWFKKEHGRSGSIDSHEEGDLVDGGFQRQQSLYRFGKMSSKGSSGDLKQALQKTKKRMEDQLKNLGFRKGKKKDYSVEENSGSYMSRRDSMDPSDPLRDSDYVILRERKLVPSMPLLNGMKRFSFLLETCQPGSVPDHHLLAALLDLPHAPVVGRAAMLLECAFFVHNLNKGQWPNWMKLNFSMFRPSMPSQPRGGPPGQRRTNILQRSAGKLFYQWAEALGGRLEEMLLEDKRRIPDIVSLVTDESRQKDLLKDDEEEDFLDEASVNPNGNECPIALRMIACILLLEITSFLRETYQALPKSSRGSGRDRPPPWERMYSRDANRRWSMALSSMGHSQASAQSLQSIVGDAAGANERKISFVLHEPDNESEGSSNTTVTMQGEEGDEKGKKGRSSSTTQHRPFLLRRGTATNATGSFKRRSLKLRRGTKDGLKEIDAPDFKRADSIQSKRKVSSISDRSDTSEPGAAGEVSGEESPGVLSDDQPLESPSDSNEADETSKNMPWLKVVVQIAHSFNFYCSHQNFCHPFCYRRQMRACERLMKAVRTIYGEESEFAATIDSTFLDKDGDNKKDKGGRGRKVSDQSSPVKRKSSLGKKEKLDGVRHRDSDHDVEKNAMGGGVLKGQGIPPKQNDPLPILKYLKTQVRNVFHAPFAALVKGAVVLAEDLFIDIMPVAWELLLETDQEVAASAASLFILCAVRAPNHASDLMYHALSNQDVSTRINAILRFQVLWKQRYQVWPRMEEGAYVTFKVPPPGIEFTLPSPKIGIESLPVVDPSWIPKVETKMEEVTISQESHRSLVTATKTRKKQQTELITMALQAQKDKRRTERENFLITTISVTEQAAYQTSQVHTAGDDHDEGDEEQSDMATGRPTHHTNAVHSLFPSCLCSSVIQIITLLDDCAVSTDGSAVYEVAYAVTWNCLVEDSPLFLRYVLERITREKQDQMFKILRHLIRFVPKLPQQAAFSLYNYIIGYVMFYVRSSHEEGQEMIGTALSVLWMVVHSVHGIMFKDLKQILRKEQCDASILLTANVPSAKKIVVHGPQEQDSGGIPSQFPVQEDTQFVQILRESLDFFGIDEDRHKEYFLVDHKTRQIHNPQSYVRDFYFFKRSQYPQLELVYMEPEEAFRQLQRQEMLHKFVEIGKVLLTWAILKNVDMVVQRVVFLHEELMKLPSFPRKALESDLDLYSGGELGKELLGLDVLHKFMWVRLIARMFEAMAGNYSYSGDIHLFLNVLNGAIILHSEDSCILRYVVATYINSAHNFKNIFSTNGYLLIMPTLLQIYSNHQTNKLVTRTVEYCVKQFYLMNRKPFILQMFGSLSSILDTDDEGLYGDAHKVQSKCLFQLLLSLETPSPDPLNIAELVKEDKPLKAIDFCYHNEDEMVTVLDCISLCVMVVAYASDSVRGHQMLIILEAILPHYLKEIQKPGYEKDGKSEREIMQQLSAAIRTLVHNAEALAKNYNGPMNTSPEHKGSSQRNYSRGPYSPGFDFDDEGPSRYLADHSRNIFHDRDLEDSDLVRAEFRRPRDILLSLVSDFFSKCSARLADMPKKNGFDVKPFELLDIRSHLRLVDIAHSLLKAAPYDMEAMACTGLQRYMNQVLPFTDWSNEAMRPALITILRRMDKLFCKIYKKSGVRRKVDWEAAAGILKGVYETLYRFPYIVHMQYLKVLISTCQALILGDCSNLDMSGTESVATRALMAVLPPPHFCSVVIKLILLQILAMGETFSLEHVCGGNSVFPDKKKSDSLLMNLVMPLCYRVGGGRKDVPFMRPQDISYTITMILLSMNPPTSKGQPTQNLKSLSEMRSGQVPGREPKKPVRLPQSTYQIAFLALKIAIISFEHDLINDWPRIARTVRDVGRIWDLGNVFWDFLDFIATYKTPLYVLLLPFLHEKIHSPPMNDCERHNQFMIREKLKGYASGQTKCRAALLMDLLHEMKYLKDELENGRPSDDRTENLRSGDGMNSSHSGDYSAHARHHRPSLIGLLSEHLLQKRPSSSNNAGGPDAGGKTSNDALKPVHSQRTSVSSVNEKVRDDDRTTADEFSSLAKSTSTVTRVSEKEGLFHRHRGIKLRFVSKVEMKNSKGETSMTPISPGSPGDDSSSEVQGRPRLQRSKAQSRKTFRLRKSRRNKVEKLENITQCSEKISYSTPATPTQISAESQQIFLEQLRQQKEQMAKEAEEKLLAAERHNTLKQKASPTPSINVAVLDSTSHPALSHTRSGTYQSHAPGLLKADLSFEDDTSAVSQTSSTSGYRESCSLVTMTMESPTLIRRTSIPATGTGTTSPDSSLTSNGAEEETAMMARSSSSQHSLMMLFEAQDEDTLI